MSDEVCRETEVPAPPSEVWHAITDPDDPDGFLGEISHLDSEPGGDLVVEDREGWVERCEEDRRLVFWWSRGQELPTRVDVELTPTEGGTHVRVLESRPLEHLETQLTEIARGGRGPMAMAA